MLKAGRSVKSCSRENLFCRMLAVTDRHLTEDYIGQIERIAQYHPRAIVLREKDMTEREYRELALQVLPICHQYEVPLVIHSFVRVAEELNIRRIHLPLHLLEKYRPEKGKYDWIGTSVHSEADAQKAFALGATCLIAGNIYETDCKKGLPGRGLEFLRNVVQTVPIPVYAIGGITPERMNEVLETGSAGGCMMSGFMKL